MTSAQPKKSGSQFQIDRRALLLAGGTAAVGLAAAPLVRHMLEPRSSVFIAKGQRYDKHLEQTIEDGLNAVGVRLATLRGKRVLLKPNLVEPTRQTPHMTTHPAVIVAAAEIFRRYGADVSIGEGPGHVRDTEMALVESGVQEALDAAGLTFFDLNYGEVAWTTNRGGASKLPGFYFPRAVIEADLIVSMPKMKTHHWVGMTGALKNMYGVIPGIQYGWPKNVLHHAGIPQTVFDINASLPATIAIVDGIVGMEGDGPIMGTAKHMGLIVVGANSTAVDATVSRIMGLDPQQVSYLNLASGKLGTLEDSRIEQRGEAWEQVAEPFEILDVPHLRNLRSKSGVLISSRASVQGGQLAMCGRANGTGC